MVSLNDGGRQAVVGVASQGYLTGSGRTRLATELFNGRFRSRKSVQLHEIAVEFELDHESVLRAFAEFQALGMVTLSENSSAIVRSPNPEETQEAYEIRAATEELAGRTAATVLKGYTAELQDELAAMRAAVARGDLDAFAEHDVKFHRDIVKASQNDVLLRVWDTLASDLLIRAELAKVGPTTSCRARARMHQGRQRTQTLRRPTLLKLEYDGLDNKAIHGMILSSLLRKGRRGPVCESFGAKLHAACMTAMISGPRYGSTSELQRAAEAIRSRARRQYNSPVTLFLEREKKMCAHPREDPTRFRITCFPPGNTCRSSVLYRAKHDNALGELCTNDDKFLHAFGALVCDTIPNRGVRPQLRRPRALLE
jgi:DNA-binding GntR family transcriptional regulator